MPREFKIDYGEDLLVQPSLSKKVDAPHIWVQVKGRSHIKSFQRPRGAHTEHLEWKNVYKWIRSIDIVVLVIWDTSANKGWYGAIPSIDLQVALADIDENALPKSFPFPIFADNGFDIGSAKLLSWRSHLWHATVRYCTLAHLAYNEDGMNSHRSPDRRAESGYRLAAVRVCLDMMEDLGILREDAGPDEDYSFTDEFLERFRLEAEKRKRNKVVNLDNEQSRMEIAIISAVRFTKTVTGTELPGALIYGFGPIISRFIEKMVQR